MNRRRKNNNERNKLIFEQYLSLFKEGYRVTVIHQRLADSFFLEPCTIERIIIKQSKAMESEPTSGVP